jgi:hypothetical protein
MNKMEQEHSELLNRIWKEYVDFLLVIEIPQKELEDEEKVFELE